LQRHQFQAYLDKVFDWEQLTAGLTEGRQFPLYPWSDAFDAVFLGSACQFGPLHRIETECRRGALHQRIGALSEDMLAYAMQRQNPAEIFALGCQVAQQLKRNGVLHSDWARGRVVAAVDGIEICSSYCRCCDACMSREVERKVGGKLQKSMQYYHRLSAVTVVSTAFPIFLGVRFQQDGETEVACSLALLRDLYAWLGRRFIDILVADALYLQTGFVGERSAWTGSSTSKTTNPTCWRKRDGSRLREHRSTAKRLPNKTCNSGTCRRWTGPWPTVSCAS